MVPFVRVAGTPYERGALLGEAFADATGTLGRVQPSLPGGARRGARGTSNVSSTPTWTPRSWRRRTSSSRSAGWPTARGNPSWTSSSPTPSRRSTGSSSRPAPVERCTAVVLRGTGRTLLGHNEQWYAGDEGTVGMVLDVSDDGPAVLAPVVAGTLPLVGLNELGGAFGTMSLSAHDERVGVPRALVARGVLEAGSPAAALARADLEDRAGGYSFLCAFPGGETCVIESTATTASTYDADVHTNHALDPSVAAAACEPSAGSRSRLARAGVLAAGAAATVEGMAALLADHAAEGQDICVHPDPAEGDEGSTILFGMICEPESRSLWLAPGHPCTAPFERFGFDGESPTTSPRMGLPLMTVLGARSRMPSLTRAEVAHLARLARLALTDGELDRLAGQLDVILGAVARVGEVAADDIPPTSHAVPLTNVFRADVRAPVAHRGAGARRRAGRRGRPLPRAADPGRGGVMTDLTRLTAAETAAPIASRRGVSAVEVTQAHLDRIAAVDGAVHAFLHVDADGALAAARGGRRAPRGRRARSAPLAGVPLALKDVVCTKGMPTTCGSQDPRGLAAAVRRHGHRAAARPPAS